MLDLIKGATVKIKLVFWVILIAIVMSGCVSTRVIKYETSSRLPKSENYPIEIFESTDVKCHYKVIGVVQANAGKLHNPSDTIEHLKIKARQMGGDALIDLQQGPSSGGVVMPVGNMYTYGNVREIWSAKVIVWKE